MSANARPMPDMAALLNIGGALCSTPQSLADAHIEYSVADGLSRSKKNFLCKYIKYNHVVCRLLVNNATDECATLLYGN